MNVKIALTVFWLLYQVAAFMVSFNQARGAEFGPEGWVSDPTSEPAAKPLTPVPRPAADPHPVPLPDVGPLGIDPPRPPLYERALRWVRRDLLGKPLTERPWEWTPAAPHHAAVVRVLCDQTGACGSGCYVDLGGVAGVLTAAHVVEDPPPYSILWADGRTDRCTHATTDRHGNDVALVLLPQLRTDVAPLPLTTSDVLPGDTVEVCGYGGAWKTLRHFSARVVDQPYEGVFAVVPGSMHGDSGGPLIVHTSDGPRVASVVQAGSGQDYRQDEAHWYEVGIYPQAGRVVAFAGRALAKYTPTQSGAAGSAGYVQWGAGGGECPPGGCLPGRRGQGQGGDGYEVYPPDGFGRGQEPPQQQPRKPSNPPRVTQQGAGPAGLLVIALAGIGALAMALRRRL